MKHPADKDVKYTLFSHNEEFSIKYSKWQECYQVTRKIGPHFYTVWGLESLKTVKEIFTYLEARASRSHRVVYETA